MCVSINTGNESVFGTMVWSLAGSTRYQGGVGVELTTEGFREIFDTMWTGVVSMKNCNVSLKAKLLPEFQR